MRLATLQTTTGHSPAVRVGERYIDLKASDPSFHASVREIVGSPALLEKAKEIAHRPEAFGVPAESAKLAAPIPDPQKIICIGLNYRNHAIETGMAIPKEPVLFSKFATALIGNGESIVLPKVSTQVDYEAELVIVIGAAGRHITKENAMNHVAGYMVGHDVSARDWQLGKDGKQWLAGKSFDTFAPCGPELVTIDEAGDANNMKISLKLNGKTMQDSTTSEFIFNVAEVVSYASIVFTLLPGDLIFTGTPPGVGIALKPQVFMQPGDVAEVEIERLGILRNPVIAE